MEKIKRFLSRLKKIIFSPKIFDILQIEVTSRCNVSCKMCPSAVLKDWKNGDMDEETFFLLLPAIELTKYVHLQGWGEPLLHPKLDKMIEVIKKKDVRCGFTTNGQLLTEKRVNRFIDLGVDIIAISLAGAEKKVHESIRSGTDFERIIKNISYLVDEKRRRRLKKPEVVISFIMTPENISQLSDIVEMGSMLGVDRVVANNVDFVPCAEIDRFRVFGLENEAYKEYIDKAKEVARIKGVDLRVYPIVPEERAICEADPMRNAYISYDGCVSPCVYLGVPIDEIPVFRDGKVVRIIPRKCFGNVKEEPFLCIWEKKEYMGFRDIFKKMKNLFIAMDLVSMAKKENSKPLQIKDLPLPSECEDCYKIFGI